MAYELEKEYLSNLPANPLSSLDDTAQAQAFFKAREDLSVYHRRHITPRVIVLQAMYNAEGDLAQYEAMRRQGIQSMSTKRGSITFASGSGSYSGISPQVIELIGVPPAPAGRLY